MTRQAAGGFRRAAGGRRRAAYWIVAVLGAAAVLGLGTPLFSLARTSTMIDPMVRRIWPQANADTLYQIQVAIRSLAHFGEYAALFLILSVGPLRGRPLAAFAVCVAVATLDEALQSLTPARSGKLTDVALDASGAAMLAVVFMPYWQWLRERRIRRDAVADNRTRDGGR